MKELNVKVGDKVIVRSNLSSDRIATVVKATPTGRIRIDTNQGVQFDKYGIEMGSDVWGRKYIKLCTPEDEKRIKEVATIKTVIKYMHEVEIINIDQARAIWDILHPSQDIEE